MGVLFLEVIILINICLYGFNSRFFCFLFFCNILLQGQHNRFSCSTNILALKKAELVRCVAAEGMNIDQILITNHLPIKLSEEMVGKLAFIGPIQC